MSWREIQRTNFRSIHKLAAFLEIPLEKLLLKSRFPLNLPVRLANKIEKGNIDDPILRQFVPLPAENEDHPNFTLDPVLDHTFCKSSKILQKYRGRALLLTTAACAMHCRYCFRQNFEYSKKPSYSQEFDMLRDDPTIKELILSGGDPLSLSTKQLADLLTDIEEIPHIEIIRFHTRFPIGIPERLDHELLNLLQKGKAQKIFVLHANHPRELDQDVLDRLKNVQTLGIPVLLQSIYLKGVNDTFETLKELYWICVTKGIIPYYLHRLDKVKGAAHFEAPVDEAKTILSQLRESLPGYALPQFVEEIPGLPSKSLINS